MRSGLPIRFRPTSIERSTSWSYSDDNQSPFLLKFVVKNPSIWSFTSMRPSPPSSPPRPTPSPPKSSSSERAYWLDCSRYHRHRQFQPKLSQPTPLAVRDKTSGVVGGYESWAQARIRKRIAPALCKYRLRKWIFADLFMYIVCSIANSFSWSVGIGTDVCSVNTRCSWLWSSS